MLGGRWGGGREKGGTRGAYVLTCLQATGRRTALTSAQRVGGPGAGVGMRGDEGACVWGACV